MDEVPLQVVLAGQFGVGKSFVFNRLPDLAERYGSTLCTVDTGTGTRSGRDKWMVHVRCSRGKETTVLLWDTGGMERAGGCNMSRGYFTRAQAVVLVYDTGDLQTLTELQEWIRMVKTYCKCRNVVLSLWGHDRGTDKNPVDVDTAQKFASTHGIAISLVFRVCASSGEGVVESFKSVVESTHFMATDPQAARQHLYQTIRAGTQNDLSNSKRTSCCYS